MTVMMLTSILDLLAHQAYTDAALLHAVCRHEAAAHDEELRTLLHHILGAHRYWLHLIQGLPFSVEQEVLVPDSVSALVVTYRATREQERVWLGGLTEADLSDVVESPFLPGQRFALRDILLQLCLHSHGHRSQCAKRLRALGGEPPVLDYILWLKDRPEAVWE